MKKPPKITAARGNGVSGLFGLSDRLNFFYGLAMARFWDRRRSSFNIAGFP